ncbi:hypothetical protein DL96DRAFT_1571487 [Flagelloscypha sp. PMI_526]|nr:hypothetical protein DL96DRAFT_1571487 [Flagelloscypha sp. PMI_526]
MLVLAFVFILATGPLLSTVAAQSPEHVILARKYAPEWRFHSKETFFPSSVEFFLENVVLLDQSKKVVQEKPTAQGLSNPSEQGEGLYLTTNIDSGRNGWLQGYKPSTHPSPVCAFVSPKDNGVTDIYYWLFTPFNSAKDVPLAGRIGDHVGDWERMMVRTVDGVATHVDYHAHANTASTIPWEFAPKFDGGRRPIGYIAQGSHGIWEVVGAHNYVHGRVLGQNINLDDITDDGGIHWDTRDSIVALQYPGTYGGNLSWLNFKGKWGNEGFTNCWWFVIYPNCKLSDGPFGPYRDDMAGGLSQVIGKPSLSETSSFTFYLSGANDPDNTDFVGLQQICESTVNREISKIVGTARRSNKVTITLAACPFGSHITSYTIGVCPFEDDWSSCVFPISHRPIRAYGNHGLQDAASIAVVDLDTWNWSNVVRAPPKRPIAPAHHR